MRKAGILQGKVSHQCSHSDAGLDMCVSIIIQGYFWPMLVGKDREGLGRIRKD